MAGLRVASESSGYPLPLWNLGRILEDAHNLFEDTAAAGAEGEGG